MRATCIRWPFANDTRSSSTCDGRGVLEGPHRHVTEALLAARAPPVEQRVVRAADRHLERAGEAALVGARLALERRDRGPELLATDGVDPPRRKAHEVLGLGLGAHVGARGLPVGVVRGAMRLHDVRSELEETHGGYRGECPLLPGTRSPPVRTRRGRRVRPLVLLAVQGARSLHAGFPFVTGAASCTFARVRPPAPRTLAPRSLFYWGVALLATAPAWIVKHPPLEDLPFHMATLRAIHSYSDPAYGFSTDFFLNLFHTQYALYYVVGSAVAYLTGVTGATVVLMSVYLGGTVLALRSRSSRPSARTSASASSCSRCSST